MDIEESARTVKEGETREIGRHVVLEHTARKLVTEQKDNYPITLGILWIGMLAIALLIAPWRGGARLFIALTIGLVLVLVSLLVAYFKPLSQRISLDVEAGTCFVEQTYLPQRKRSWQLPLPAICGMRVRPRRWSDPGSDTEVEWVVEVTDEEDNAWLLAKGNERESMAELARLAAEIASCSLEELK